MSATNGRSLGPVGAPPIRSRRPASVAQGIEQRFPKPRVAGSSPAGGTTASVSGDGGRCGAVDRLHLDRHHESTTMPDMPHPTVLPTLTLGDTDVTRIGLGTNRLTTRPSTSPSCARRSPPASTTSTPRTSYTGGESEQAIGAALAPSVEASSWRRRAATAPARAAPRCSGRRSSRASARCDRRDRALLPAPRRPGDAARGEPRRDQGVRRPRQDPPRRRLGGRASTRSSGPARSCRSRPCRTTTTSPSAGTRTSSTTAPREGIVFVPFFPLRGDGGRGARGDRRAPRRDAERRSRSPGCSGARR